jgi:hypothetical protein
VLSAAVLEARRSKGPPALTTPLRTRSPSERSTGFASPVSADSSSTAVPLASRPSTGTISPGLTSSRSPGRTLSIGGDTRREGFRAVLESMLPPS